MVDADAERHEQPIPPALLRPPVESVEHGLPRAELRRKVPPWNACSSPPEHSLDEPTIVDTGSTDSRLVVEDLDYLLPLLIGQLRSDRHRYV